MTTIIKDLRIKINVLVPNAIFTEGNEDYDTIEWLDNRNIPSKTAVQNVTVAEIKLTNYAEYRQKEYPKIEDQLDMLYNDIKDGTTTWVDSITATKTKYPKPT